MSETTNNQRGTIVVLSEDLFFGMRIRTTLRGMEYGCVLTKTAEAFTARFQSTDGQDSPVLGLVDFNRPVAWGELQTAVASGIPIVAFGPHTDVEAFKKARASGVARVISNGSFSSTLPELIVKYARVAAE